MLKNRISSVAGLAFALLVLAGTVLVAQEVPELPQPSALAQQNLRPYWHVFAAYAIVIVMVGGWAFSIARRLKGVEDRLGG